MICAAIGLKLLSSRESSGPAIGSRNDRDNTGWARKSVVRTHPDLRYVRQNWGSLSRQDHPKTTHGSMGATANGMVGTGKCAKPSCSLCRLLQAVHSQDAQTTGSEERTGESAC